VDSDYEAKPGTQRHRNIRCRPVWRHWQVAAIDLARSVSTIESGVATGLSHPTARQVSLLHPVISLSGSAGAHSDGGPGSRVDVCVVRTVNGQFVLKWERLQER